MSGINISYEIAKDGTEIGYFDESSSLTEKKPSDLANVIAGEIVNEILENALDIATHSKDSGEHWKETKKYNSACNITVSSHKNYNEGRPGETNEQTDCIGDNLTHVIMSSPVNLNEVIDGLNQLSTNCNALCEKSNVESVDVEMKKLLTDMLTSTSETISYDGPPVKGGVGDQPIDEKSESLIDKINMQQELPRSVEKKSRVTDLVKNSPQIISQYLMMDKTAKQNQEEWEESQEKLLQVIELDCVELGDEMFKIQHSCAPENIALPTDDDEGELIQMPSDDIMDIVDLSAAAFKNEEQLLSMEQNGTGAKGDEYRSNLHVVSSSERENISGEVIEQLPRHNQKEIDLKEKAEEIKDPKFKKKKWNIGTKLWGFLKKSHKQQE